MKLKQIVLFTLLILFLLLFFFISQKENSHEAQYLTFSNTQEWDTELYGMIETEAIIVKDARQHITLPEPPRNDSDITHQELEQLHAFQEERTPEKVEQIVREIDIETVSVGPYTFGEITNADTHPYTRHLLKSVLDEYDPIVMYFKNHFDRVRPSILDSTLTTAINIPGHPAYPSGHSSQAHLFAHIMSDIDPQNTDTYWKIADEVARNREVAGVHYPSDSEAGKLLAEQYYNLLKETVWYKTMLENARTEW